MLELSQTAIGEESIRRYLDEQIIEPPEAEAHRLKAARARRRYSAIDAERMLSIVGNDELVPVAAEVRRRLAAVVERATKA